MEKKSEKITDPFEKKKFMTNIIRDHLFERWFGTMFEPNLDYIEKNKKRLRRWRSSTKRYSEMIYDFSESRKAEVKVTKGDKTPS